MKPSQTQSIDFKTFISAKVPSAAYKSVEAVLKLTEEGSTVPFIARYRKEKTGNLDEVVIRDIISTHEEWNEILKRKDFIHQEINKQGNLTKELSQQILACFDLGELEEIYRPYKRKKKTKATLAREAGIEPLADWIWGLGQGEVADTTTLEVKAKDFVNVEKAFVTYEEILRGAQHILVEKISNNVDLRKQVKDYFFENSKVVSVVGQKYKTHSKYEMYKEFSEQVKSLISPKSSHRYLALRRGWQENELKVSIDADLDPLLNIFTNFAIKKSGTQADNFLSMCAKAALTVHVVPSITNELHRTLKDEADKHAIDVFAENLRRVLMGSPFGAKVVLGIDPGLRTGCKIALVDKSGRFISHTVLHTQGDKAFDNAKKLFEEVTKQIAIEAIAVGNGTAGRETEEFVRKTLKEIGQEQVPVILVNESGASIYSASDIARGEFPDLDLTVRGAISIARRLQDPLAELVKIDPKSIGVGQYQHDVAQGNLKKSLHDVVESCVNKVGVDLNTASESLLQYVAGIGPALAKNIIKRREDKGLFEERDQLLEVASFSSKAFEQAAGFLRIPNAKTILDSTGIHPESYKAVQDMAKELGLTVGKLMGQAKDQLSKQKDKWVQLVGEFTFEDIIRELDAIGRDPRDPFKVFKFREDIHEVKDLKDEMICPGIVTNVTNFGAFVDIGVHQDGLVHISELAHEFVDDPRKVVNPGDQVKVKVLKVDGDKNQISLSMLITEKPQTNVARKKPAQSKAGAKTSFKGKSKKPQQKTSRKPGARPERRPPKPNFNNPFAALGDIKVNK